MIKDLNVRFPPPLFASGDEVGLVVNPWSFQELLGATSW
jgi:hypothetical protein